MAKKHENSEIIKSWLKTARKKMQKLEKDEDEGEPIGKNGKIRITWKVNPQQTVEVEPGEGISDFEIFDFDEY